MAIEWWIRPAAPTMPQIDAPCWPKHCHVETRMNDFCRQVCFLQNQECFMTMFWHNCPHSRFHREWSDCQHCSSQWHPHTITETIRFILTMCRYSGIYFSLAVLHTLTLPSQYARLNLDSLEKSMQDQLSVTVQLRVLVHHRRRLSQFWRLLSVFVQQHGCRLPDHGVFSG